jgi:hypothetical protein
MVNTVFYLLPLHHYTVISASGPNQNETFPQAASERTRPNNAI